MTKMAYLDFLKNFPLVPMYPFRDSLRCIYNEENPDAEQATILGYERENPGRYQAKIGRGNVGKTCRRERQKLILQLREILYARKLLNNIMTVKKSGEDVLFLFYDFPSTSKTFPLALFRNIFTRSNVHAVDYASKHRLGMLGMMHFLAKQFVISLGDCLEQKCVLLILSFFFRKNMIKKKCGIKIGHQVGRMRNGHFLREGKHCIPTYRFNFHDAITISLKYKKFVKLADRLWMFASIISLIPEPNSAPEPNRNKISIDTPISQDILNFLKSLIYIFFNLRRKKEMIHHYFIREYLQIIFGFTVLSTKERMHYSLFNLFGNIHLSHEESECFPSVVSFMKNCRFTSSQEKFFQKKVEELFVSGSDVSVKQKFGGNDTLLNILIFVFHEIYGKEVFSSWDFLLK
jgi:hypothetical protein